MADKGMTLAIVLLVAGLIVGGGIGYFAAPPTIEVESNSNYPVSPIFSRTLPSDMSDVTQFSTGNYVIYVWSQSSTVYWTYARVGG